MSRFVLLDRPQVLPMKCAICGSGDSSKKYADMGINIERFGRLYLCSGCILEVAGLVNMIPVVKLTVAERKYKAAVKRLAEVIDENGELKNAVATLRNLDSSGDSVRGNNSVRPVAEFPESDEETRRDNSESSKSDSSGKSGSVPKTTELFQFS